MLLGLSVLFHAVVLGGLSLGWRPTPGPAEASAMAVTLIDPPPFVRPAPTIAPPEPQPAPVHAVVLADTPPRYAPQPANAATGDAQDAVDLFGPVFADGMWPRPVLVKSEPCDPTNDPRRAETCRRETLLIGLASDRTAGSNPRP